MLDCRYGRRYIRRVDDDGEVAYDGLPLKLEDLLHPEEGDELVAVLGHSDDCGRLRKGLTRLTPQNKTFAILEDVNVDLGLPGVKPIRPDVSVFEVPTVPAGLREMGTFYMKRHAAKPVLFIEVTSESTRPNDLVEKYTFAVLYDQHGVVPDSVELAVQLKDERLISQEHKQHAEKANERAEQARLKLEAEKLRADSAEIKIHRLATLATFQRDSRLDCL
ncbi:MAG: hypothetical protein O3A00_27940, partial [Planctomycetota bacterium]|nr:hypothetical protein [Planctomycetota bacterium]